MRRWCAHGQESGQVVAVLQLAADHPARVALRENEIADDAELIMRRVQYADGRTRAFINDQPVGAGLMQAIGRQLVEIHGQHDDRALVDAATHRALLDAFGGLDAEVARGSRRARRADRRRRRGCRAAAADRGGRGARGLCAARRRGARGARSRGRRGGGARRPAGAADAARKGGRRGPRCRRDAVRAERAGSGAGRR